MINTATQSVGQLSHPESTYMYSRLSNHLKSSLCSWVSSDLPGSCWAFEWKIAARRGKRPRAQDSTASRCNFFPGMDPLVLPCRSSEVEVSPDRLACQNLASSMINHLTEKKKKKQSAIFRSNAAEQALISSLPTILDSAANNPKRDDL